MTTRCISVTPHDLEALRRFSFLDSNLARSVQKWLPGDDRRAYDIPTPICEDIGDRLTELLGKYGFDENYNPTPEGESLEKLIDVFAGLR